MIKALILRVAYFTSCLLSVGLLWIFCGLTSPAMAEQVTSPYITSTEQFYDYYGENFTKSQKKIIKALIKKFQPYLEAGTNAQQLLIANGYIPLTPQLKAQGSLWTLPSVFKGEERPATDPIGVFLDGQGRIVNVVWIQNKYDSPKIKTLLANGSLDEKSYTEFKQQSLLPKPAILSPFDQYGIWHYHENLTIENLGSLQPEQLQLKQALFDTNWINSLKQGLADPGVVVAVYESDYPYNKGITDGAYMSQMWIGLGNPDGLFAKFHPEVSPQGLDILDTFEQKY